MSDGATFDDLATPAGNGATFDDLTPKAAPPQAQMQNTPVMHLGPVDILHPEEGLNGYLKVPAFEQFPEYAADRPVNNPADIVKNASSDAEEFIRGMGGLLSLPGLRMREIMEGQPPIRLPDAFHPGASDPERLGQAALGLGAHYFHRYLDPLQQNSNPLDIMGAYAKKWAQSPLGTFIDLGLPAAVKPTVTLTSPIVRMLHPRLDELLHGAAIDKHLGELVTAQAGKNIAEITQADREMTKALESLPPEYQGPAFTAFAEQTGGATPAAKRILAKMAADPQARAALKTIRKWSNRVYGILLPSTSTHLVAQTGPARMAGIYRRTGKQLPFQEFYPSTGKPAENLMPGPPRSLGAGEQYHPLEIAKKARAKMGIEEPVHIPIVSKRYAAAVEQTEHLPFGGHKGRIMRLAAKMARKEYESLEHAAPDELPGTFKPRLKSKMQDTHNQAPAGTPSRTITGKQGEYRVSNNRQALHDAHEYSSPYYTVRGVHHVHNAGRAVKVALINALQYKAIKNILEHLRTVTGDTAYHKGWHEVNVVKAFEDLARESGIDEEAIQSTMQKLKREHADSIWLPPKAAKILYNALRPPQPVGKIRKFARFSNSIYLKGLFRYDPTFETLLAIRTAVLQGFTFRHPKDVATFIAANMLAADPAVAKRFGAAILRSHETNLDVGLIKQIDAATHPNPVMRAGAQFAQIVQKALDIKSRIGYRIHNHQRLATFIHDYYKAQERMYNPAQWVEGAPFKQNITKSFTDALAHSLSKVHDKAPTIQQLFADTLNTSNTLDKMNLYFADPQNLLAGQRSLTGLMGIYDHSFYQDIQGLRDVMPLGPYAWHCKLMIIHIPTTYPIKTAMLTTLSHIMVDKFGIDEHGRLPMKNADGSIRLGPKGGVMNFNGPQLDPLAGGFELVNDVVQVGNAVFDPKNFQGVKSPSVLNPAIRAAGTIFMTTGLHQKAIDLDTGETYLSEHPDAERIPGVWPPQYRNAWTKEGLSESSMPPLWWANVYFPKQTPMVQAAMAHPGQASKWTSGFAKEDKAQKRVGGKAYRPDTGFRPPQQIEETWGFRQVHLGATEGRTPDKRVWGRVISK